MKPGQKPHPLLRLLPLSSIARSPLVRNHQDSVGVLRLRQIEHASAFTHSQEIVDIVLELIHPARARLPRRLLLNLRLWNAVRIRVW
ncbi:hypothetical protein EMIT0P43_30288 [Pseudomonas jessenii]